MQVKAVEQLHPEWTGWANDAGEKQHAMDIDARRGTHPVIMHIEDVSQAEGAFDTITYAKGAQVVRTLEAWQGDDTFRDGVRRYIARHAYGNTVTEDLWRALDVDTPRPVAAIARDLTLQAGVPLVTELDARCVDGHTVVALAQGQFSIDAPRVARWRVPVKVAVLGGGQTRAVIAGAAPQDVTVPGCGPVVINAGQSSYARVRYSAAGLAALVPAFGRLGVDDQLGLLADTQALALAGRLPMGELLALMAGVPPSRGNPAVAQLLAAQLQDLDRLHDGLASQPAFRGWARALLAPFLAEVGWDSRDSDSGDVRTLRVQLIEALGGFGDARVLADVDKAFERVLEHPDSLDADHRDAVLSVVATRADERAWQQLHGLALAAPSELEKADAYERLGRARDPVLAGRALALAISGEPPTTVASRLLRAVGRAHPGLTLDFIAGHWAQVEPLFGEGAGATIAARFFDTGADAALLPRLDTFVRAHVPAATRERIVKNAAVIRYRAAVRGQRLPEADRWIAAHAPAA